MNASELSAWAAIVAPILLAIGGAHLSTYMKVETTHAALDDIKEDIQNLRRDQREFQAESIQDSKELSERVRKLEVDVKEAISFSALIKDILGRIAHLERGQQ